MPTFLNTSAHVRQAAARAHRCRQRWGEATAIFLDDSPTVHYLAPLLHWHARAQDRVGVMDRGAANFQQYIKLRRDTEPADPLAVAAQRLSDAAPRRQTSYVLMLIANL